MRGQSTIGTCVWGRGGVGRGDALGLSTTGGGVSDVVDCTCAQLVKPNTGVRQREAQADQPVEPLHVSRTGLDPQLVYLLPVPVI
jgi:hypothetical protein